MIYVLFLTVIDRRRLNNVWTSLMTRREETAKGEVTSRIMSPTDDWRWIKKIDKIVQGDNCNCGCISVFSHKSWDARKSLFSLEFDRRFEL